MKKLLIILAITILSCDKQDRIRDCEINQTYELLFKNSWYNVSVLKINQTEYNVKNIYQKEFIVPVNAEISIKYKIKKYGIDTKPYYKDTIVFMQGNPNPCSIYNLFY